MRHPEPEMVKLYRDWIQYGPPKCCHTCDKYDQNGKCTQYDRVPPEDVAAAISECDEYVMEPPF